MELEGIDRAQAGNKMNYTGFDALSRFITPGLAQAR